MLGAINNGLHGRPVTITAVSPATAIFVHHCYPASGSRAQTFEVYLAICNRESGAGRVEVSYNGGIQEITIAGNDTRMVFLNVRGASADFTPAGQASVGIRWAAGFSGELTVTGGWRDGKNL